MATHEFERQYIVFSRSRVALSASHAVLGAAAGLALLSQHDFSHFHYWGRRGGYLVGVHLWGSWPYVASLIACYRRVIPCYLRLVLFVLVLTAATAAAIAGYLGIDGVKVRSAGILAVTATQFALFLAARAAFTRPTGGIGGAEP